MTDNQLALTRAVASVLSSRPCGVALDIDGTISPIAPDPGSARVSPLCLQHMAALVGQMKLVAVVSGRPVLMARDMVGLEGVEYVGCHGLERLRGGQVLVAPEARHFQSQVREISALLSERLSGKPETVGLLVEDKTISTTFHYRNCRDPELARSAILDALEGMGQPQGLKIMHGRRAVELLPDIAVDKGTAVLSLIREFGLRGFLYAGDDQTDVAAFRAVRRWQTETGGRGLALAVSGPDTSEEVRQEAGFTVSGVAGVETFLGLIVRLFTGKPSVLRPSQ
ncbi:MAG: trehalose-phosphatase [Dehalococcoidia bacterium]|nr:trehalose-phosphatase [Dehalococcoidia bacterium]